MAKRFSRFLLLAVTFLVGASVVLGQVSTSGTLQGTVSDATGAVIAGADVKARDEATGTVFETKSGVDGSFRIANLRPGTYVVSISMQGFKTAEYRDVKVITGQIYELSAKLEVGEMQSTVVVEAGAVVLETASTTIGTTITGKAINTLPLTSRDALDLAILMPGAATTGRVRQTSFMGLPKGAINITYDGINAQDNILKSSDGFFTIIRPKIDTVEEFSITTAGQTGEKSSEGAVQISFETKRGGNEYHGSAWWYHRNDFFNSNYWFSNLAGQDRQRQRLNQYGAQVNGPILKEKLFFFVAMDRYQQPSSRFRSRTILAPNSLSGIYEYNVSALPTIPAGNTWTTCGTSSRSTVSSGLTCTVNLYAMAAAGGLTVTPDPIVANILSQVDAVRGVSSVSISNGTTLPFPAPHIDNAQFNNPGVGDRRFPDLRLDWNITKAHTFSFIYHYNWFSGTPDFLNGFDQTFPVAPFNTNQGSQISNRNQFTAAWRWNLAANMSNELRWGVQSAPVSFFPDMNLSIYPTMTTNEGTLNVRPTFPIISNPFLPFSVQGRNTPIAQLIETFSWTKGKHSFNFGGTWTEVRLYSYFNNTIRTANIGLSGNDTVLNNLNTSSNFPGSDSTQRGTGLNLLALLGARITSVTGNVSVDESQRQYVPGAPGKQRVHQTEFGLYGGDSWRIHPTLTINASLRWEYQGAPQDPKGLSFRVRDHLTGVWGVSGLNNLFQPGNLPGSIPVYEPNSSSDPWYEKDFNNWAPSIGLAWSPNYDNRWYNMIFGGPGKTVFRTNYAITFTREGINNYLTIANSNPGFNSGVRTDNSTQTACAPPYTSASTGTFPSGCLTLNGINNGELQAMRQAIPTYPTAPFQMTAFIHSVNAFAPNLSIPYVQNWSFGIQRELTPSTVVEVRYIGNHSVGLWRQDNINEVNIFENGFLTEFQNAQRNLAICRALGSAGGCATARFSNQGLVHPTLGAQVPVPIFTAAFTGSTTGSQTNANFSSGTFITPMDNNQPGSVAGTLTGQSFACNMFGSQTLQGAGTVSPCPTSAPLVGPFASQVNFFIANPWGGAFRMYNGSQSTYNGLTVEVRRRPSKGLQLNANYTFAKSLTNNYADSSISFAGFSTLRDRGRDKGNSPWDLTHAFKMQLIYEMPFGYGKRWTPGNPILNHVVGGWEISAIDRWQSGRVFLLTGGRGGTFNTADGGVQLIGITRNQLQDMLSVRKMPNGQVFYFPASLISSSGATAGQANRAFLRPCGESTPSEMGTFCRRVFLYGPSFHRADISVIKRFRVTESINVEYRAEFLNAFNDINFFFPGSETTSVGTAALTSGTFGRITNAFQDTSTTDDNGGRIIQMVLRINF
jgi:hypothetical protein